MNETHHGQAKTDRIKRWSPVWIVPVVTLLIGGWILFYHLSHQGPEVMLITENAEGIVAGKTTIKSRNVDVGVVEHAVLTDDLHHVEVKVQLNAGMEKLLHGNSVFWVVKPQIGREGVSGLGTLLSGSYIELQPGNNNKPLEKYPLLDSPPLAPSDAKGIRIILDSEKSGQLNPGDPVLFRGFRVGTVETSNFDVEKRIMVYQLFISTPYDRLVTTNVRFWKDSGIAVNMSSSGMRVEMGSLVTLLSGGVSFDVPDGWERGQQADDKTGYHLFDNRDSIQASRYTDHVDFLLFFNDSIRGLQPGAPVEFRGIQLGTVAQVPLHGLGTNQAISNDYRVPVLIRIEPGRFVSNNGKNVAASEEMMAQHLQNAVKRGLRATLKTGNLLSGALYVDFDFYDNAPPYKGPDRIGEYTILPTVSGGLNQIQQKLMTTLDKINGLPLDGMVTEATGTLVETQRTLRSLQQTLNNLNTITTSPTMQKLPADMQQTLREMNRSLKGLQPGSPTYSNLVSNMQHLDQVLRELQPVLKTLNAKSNALVFEAKPGQDPHPERARP